MIEFKLPELGENIEQGDLVRLMVEPGASVSTGQSVMELETDKAVVEVPSSVTGTVQEIRVKEGDKIKVGQVIFTVDGAEAKAAAQQSEAANPAPAASPSPQSTGPQEPIQGEQAEQEHAEVASPPSPVSPIPSSSATTSRTGASEFKLPELGENISQGDLVRLMITPGAKVSEGQPVMELETDKAVVEVPSSVSGVVKEVKVKEGEKIKVGQVIFTLEGGAVPAETTRARNAPVEHVSGQHGARLAFQAAIRAEGKTEEQALPPDQPQQAGNVAFTMPVQLGKVAGTEHRQPIPAAPHVRRFAREVGVDIYEVKGSGPGGRISEDDVKAYAKGLLSSAATAAQATPRAGHFAQPQLPDFAKWGKVERVSMRGVRRKTAEHLAEAWNTIPHVTQHDRADITELEQLRDRFAPKAEEAGGKMTVTAIALKVCAAALKVFPQFNASIDIEKEEIVYKQYISIGVAADTDRGLLVPGDPRGRQEEHCRTGGRVVAALQESAGQEADPGRYGRRHIHDHESGWHWRHWLYAHRELSGSGDSRPVAIANGAGMDERQIRAAPDSAALAFLRSPSDRRCRCGPLPALDRGSLRAAIPPIGARIEKPGFKVSRFKVSCFTVSGFGLSGFNVSGFQS